MMLCEALMYASGCQRVGDRTGQPEVTVTSHASNDGVCAPEVHGAGRYERQRLGAWLESRCRWGKGTDKAEK